MPDNLHDKGYKRILAKKRNFYNLLTYFIKETWVSEIQEENLELIDKEFILKDFKEQESDIIYRLKFNGKEVIFYCLLELQSTVDYAMPFRLLMYMTDLWRRCFNDSDDKLRERASFRLPAIIPVVLYNGQNEWTAVRSFKEYLNEYECFGNSIVNFEYIFLNVNKYEDESLKEIGNLIASVFLLDKSQSVERLKDNLTFINDNFANMTKEEKIDFRDWIKDVLIRKAKWRNQNLVDKAVSNFEEGDVENMTYAIERLFDEIEEKGREQGREQGWEQSRLEMAMAMLKDNEPLEKIAKYTGIPLHTIKGLKNNS